MNILKDEATLLTGVFIGAAGTWFTLQFGAAVMTSGWTSAASATALAAAAAFSASGRWLSAKADPILRDPASMPAPARNGSGWRQAETPREWLDKVVLGSMPLPMAEDVIRSRLAGSLRFLDGDAAAKGDPNLPPEVAALAACLNLAPEVAALAAALAARSVRGRCWGEGMRLTALLSDLHAGPEGPHRQEIRQEALALSDSLLRDVDVAKAYAETLPRHGTRETAMMGLLGRARRNGPVGTGEFPWLKTVDRPLWYALDNLGRQTFHVEGLAAMDHFRSEKLAGVRLATPHVAQAAEALAAIERSERGNPAARRAGVPPDQVDEADEADEFWPGGSIDLDFGSFYGRRPPPGRA